MNPNPNFWLSLGGMAAVVTVVGTAGLFVLRLIIRSENERANRPLERRIAVLWEAVFNHLSHGEVPDEHAISRRLGLED